MEFNKPNVLNLDGNIAEDFKTFKEEVLIYFSATESEKKPRQVQVARLKNLLGTEGLKLYKTLTCDDGNTETVLSILNVLEEHCLPQQNEIMDIFNFFSRTQQPHESFEKFYADLKKLVKPCSFQDQEKKLLRAQIVLGIKSKSVKERLLREDISLEKTISFCKSIEAAEKNLCLMEKGKHESQQESQVENLAVNGQHTEDINVNTVSKDNFHYKPIYRSDFVDFKNKREPLSSAVGLPKISFVKCNKCGYGHDKQARCPAYGKMCNKCKKMNHFALMCKTKNVTYNKDFKQCQDLAFSCEKNDFFSVNSVNQDSECNVRSWNETIKVEGIDVQFKLDSGAEVNILPLSFVKENKLDSKLEKCSTKLQAFGGFTVDPIGKLKCLVESKTRISDAEFIIVKNCKNPLIGLSTCIKLNLIKKVEFVKDMTKSDVYLQNKQVFDGIGCFPDLCKIKLSQNAEPKISSARRIPLKIRHKFKTTLDDLVKKEIIVPVNEPVEWVNNVVIVEKPNGALRVCIDPKELNKYIIREKYTIPTLEELAPALSNKRFFTVLDIKDGFYHVKLDEKSSKMCSISTVYGTYRFLRAPFGLSCMPEIFQKLVHKYFGDIPGVSIYFDDLCIAGNTKDEMDVILNKVFERANKYNIKFNVNKLQYCVNEVNYLGVIFNKDGMSPDPEKISSIKALANPTNKTELQQLMGLVNYLRSFIPNLAELTAPFRELLKKNIKWQWTESHTASLEVLKNIICSQTVLATFNEKLPIDIQCDSSKDAVGCCILQNGKPVSFASRCLSSAEIQYAQIEKELLAITFACSKFHYYIYGQQNVTVYTDHMPLLSVMNKNMNMIKNKRLRRLKLKLIDYNFELKYLSGKKMYIADLLSRNIVRKPQQDDESMKDFIHTLCVEELSISDEKTKEFQDATEKDENLKLLCMWYKEGWPRKCTIEGEIKHYFNLKNDIFLENGLFYYHNRLIVPSKFRTYILKLLHETHTGIVKTKLNARKYFYWPGIMSDIESYISGCSLCLKYYRSNTKDLLINHAVPQIPFNKVGIDIAEHAGKNYLILVDYFSRWLEIVTLNTKTSSEVIMKLKEIFSHNGIPNIVISDNMPFKSYEFSSFAKEWNFQICTSSPHYPKSNGLAEKGVGIAKLMLKKAWEEKKDIQLYLLNYRNTPLADLNVSPAQLLMSRNLRSKLPVQNKYFEPTSVHNEIYNKMIINQQKQKVYHDSRARKNEISYEEGEKILIQNLNDFSWEKGDVVRKLNQPRSYLVQMDSNGKVFRRNSVHMRKLKENQRTKIEQSQAEIQDPLNRFPTNNMASKTRSSVRKRCTPKRLDL